MLRRVLLVVMATVVSFALTAGSGYIIYALSEGRSEAHLSLLVRFVFNPLIALVVGILVGFLSKDHPSVTSIVGILPWATVLQRSMSIAPIFVYVALGAIASAFAWRFRSGRQAGDKANISVGVIPG